MFGSEGPDTDDSRRLPVWSHENSPNGPDLTVRLLRTGLSGPAEVLNAEIGLQRLPLVCNITQRREEPCLEPANRVRRTEEISPQLPGIDLRTVGVGKEHDKILPSSCP